MEVDQNKYNECCLFGIFHNCGPSSQSKQRKNLDWVDQCIAFGTLSTIDVTPYLISIGVVSESTNQMIMSEKQLIMNRISPYTLTSRNNSMICPLHRYTYGVHWKDNKKCAHPDHPSIRPIPKVDCRRATLDVIKTISGFIVGGRLCSTHRKNLGKSNYDDSQIPITVDNDKLVIEDDNDQPGLENPLDIENSSIDDIKRSQFNLIFCETSSSPLKSSAIKPFGKQSDSSLRRLTSKYKRGIQTLKEEYAEAIAPGQGYKLIRLAEESYEDKDNYEKETTTDMVDQLKLLHKAYVAHKVPFREQVQLLSILPQSWTTENIMLQFSCSKYAAKLAKAFRRQNDYMMEDEPNEIKHRQRTNSSVAKHFISWLVETGCLVTGTYGITNIKMDDDTKIQLPKQILQTQKYHIIMQYRRYCDETNFNGYGKTKLYDILNSINPSEQHALAGLDEFVTDGMESWKLLKDMIETFAIPQIDKKRLQKQVDMGLLYQKHGYSQHCEEHSSCTYHCVNYALSDPKIKEFKSSCSVAHTETCAECNNIFHTLAEIEHHISNIIDSEHRQELSYDFHNAAESIIELFRHIVRGVCQDNEKTKIINSLTPDSTFAVFDWGQKIIPHAYRESQKEYYGKKGMSLLVGSFAVRNSQPSTTITPMNATTTTRINNANYITSTYIVALTAAIQNDLDTLSATQLIIENFHEDYPFVKYVFKRSDNAGNFSSHSTAEAEYLICKKFGLKLVIRDYSEIQKGKDICDRICGVAKSRMRSWHHSGNDVLNAFDVKEGMEAYGGIKNLKISVGEIVHGKGCLSQSMISNVSSVRSIRYSKNGMLIRKASGIGTGLYVPFKNITFDINMKLVSDFNTPINQKVSLLVPSSRQDRAYNESYWCPVDNCTMVFYNQDDLNLHIISNQHQMNTGFSKRQSTNDVARIHLMESLKTVSINNKYQTTSIIQQQSSSSQTSTTSNLLANKFITYLDCEGWALRVRKPGQRISPEVKTFIEKMWKGSLQNGRGVKAELVYESIRRERNDNNEKLFKPDQYVSIGQIKYQLKKLGKKYGLSSEEQLINDLLMQKETANTRL